MAVQFFPEEHKYVSVDPNEGIEWTSVTSVVSTYKEQFDADAVALKCSKNKKSKWYGKSVEEIKEIWKSEGDKAVNLGTWYHNERETDLLSCETINRNGVDLRIVKSVEVDGIKIAPNQKLENGIYPEHFTYLKSAGICGQSDRVEVINNIVDIYDYKTNKEINFESYKNWENISKKMKAPVQHLDDCNANHYALQLSFYMYMILKHNPKLKPGKLYLDHVLFKYDKLDEYGNKMYILDINGNPIIDKVQRYELPYLKNEVIAIIQHRGEQKLKKI